MGLIMRYVLEREYDIELDFTDSVPIRVGGNEIDFCFEDMNTRRVIAAEKFSSGIIRSTIDGPMYELDEGGLFSSSEWKPFYGVLTNIGLLRFNIKNPTSEVPRIMSIRSLKLETMSNQKLAFKGNLFRVDFNDEKDKKRQLVFSVDDPTQYQEWCQKIRELIKEYKQFGDAIIDPKFVKKEKDVSM